MFGNKKPPKTIDITQKTVKTWYGGTKTVPTTRAEQKKMQAELKRTQPHATILDSAAKKRLEREHKADWLEEMFLMDTILDD